MKELVSGENYSQCTRTGKKPRTDEKTYTRLCHATLTG